MKIIYYHLHNRPIIAATKYENLSGTIEALLIFVAAGWIIFEAVHNESVSLPTLNSLLETIKKATYNLGGFIF